MLDDAIVAAAPVAAVSGSLAVQNRVARGGDGARGDGAGEHSQRHDCKERGNKEFGVHLGRFCGSSGSE